MVHKPVSIKTYTEKSFLPNLGPHVSFPINNHYLECF